ncbi:SNARE-associated protein Snapin isoform X1 [Marmota monax]|uniref:SNARE-associated protein Snapin isoform X1 n=1 Tax=Marmota flaviventris TaxID=93162 RepID=UPI000FFFBCA0|nr:SNARE-associated protein Snapin isoform X1 [Marmota flaviventris]XP_046277672.1 SNARE-associated protein Snapin isoform X1 [Marmota monax]
MAGAGSAAVSGAGTPVAGPTGRDLFAEGLLEFLRPAVQQLDSHVHAVRESQVELREQIDNLAAELCRINEDQKVALDLDPYVKKLLNARRRVVLVNNILQNAQPLTSYVNFDAGPSSGVSSTWLAEPQSLSQGQSLGSTSSCVL